jgi:hypothetical protein
VLHADSADNSSTDIFNHGVSHGFGLVGSGGSVLRQCGIFLFFLLVPFFAGAAFNPPAQESVDKLKIKKLSSIRNGLVFINGKYIAPPYTLERRGTAIYINSNQATQEVVPWDNFLKLQQGYRIEKIVPEGKKVIVEESVPVEIEEEVEVEVAEENFDDLFGDEASSADSGKTHKVKRKIKRTEYRVQKVEKIIPSDEPAVDKVCYDGPFRYNFRVKSLLSKIDRELETIGRNLSRGWIFCFGDSYPRAEGDHIAAKQVLDVLWVIGKRNSVKEAFINDAQSSGIGFLPRYVIEDFYRNRLDYHVIQRRAQSGN